MHALVRYRLNPEDAEQDRALLARMYEELAVAGPQWLRQATFELDDGLAGLTLVQLDREPGALREVEPFQRYRTGFDERCQEPPTTTLLHQVGAYRLP